MTDPYMAPAPIEAAVKGLCPRCGAPGLFDGFLHFAPSCRECALDYSSFNVGDGAAAFLILIIGAIVSVLAIVTDLKLSPPWWVHMMLWIPLTIALTVGSLRIAKGVLIALEFRNAAREGRIADRD
ncbi:Uncharacterized conserved protein, DUF983 family [Sphingomonas sp. YR710]|jgi:uncharacterized protein (DUF983 family)|uniref:DUF983 domain-containing protein n=1 Tax=Sphingomonas sp. YR710 TaxID=1882773 RepID=UPI000883C85C|nr:DUF983 domain-containing protein [Sphingomonas sp. YR710]SDC01659.1 Uncharacterized conserved protein, DUF983 family [Sphingomonas sp. YR710]